MTVSRGPAFVVDASVGAKLVLKEEDSFRAHAVFRSASDGGGSLHVPDHFFVECAQALRRAVRRRDLDLGEAAAVAEALAGLGLESAECRHLAGDALRIAEEASITVYDALYVALADRTGAPLVTADRRLFDALSGTRHRVRWLGEFAEE